MFYFARRFPSYLWRRVRASSIVLVVAAILLRWGWLLVAVVALVIVLVITIRLLRMLRLLLLMWRITALVVIIFRT